MMQSQKESRQPLSFPGLSWHNNYGVLTVAAPFSLECIIYSWPCAHPQISLLRLLSQCDEKDLSVLLATATALAGTDRSSVNGILMPQGRKKPAVQIVYLYRRLFFSALLYLSQSVPQTEDCIFHFNRLLRLNNSINPLTDSKKIANQFLVFLLRSNGAITILIFLRHLRFLT